MPPYILRYLSQEPIRSIVLFAVIVIAAKFGQYAQGAWNTSPAILWPPTGIALAAVWLWGYRYSGPVFFGLFLAAATGPGAHLLPAVVSTLGRVIGVVVGAFLLKKVKFDGWFATMRSVLAFFAVVIVTGMIEPTISMLVAAAAGDLTSYVSWTRSWAGHALSCLVFTPLLIAWSMPDRRKVTQSVAERVIAILFLMFSVYFLFWTRAASNFTFLFFGFFFLAHFWIAFRSSARMLAFSLFVTTVFGILGLFLSPVPGTSLSDQLFAAELFLFLVAPIFYIFFALVKERAHTVEELKEALGRIEKEGTVKNEFIVVLAHELRNPLAPIKTTLEILELEEHDPETKHLIKRAHQQVHSMRRLLDDLLDITRVTQGKFELKLERAHLCTLIDRCVDSTRELFKERGHTLEVHPPCNDSIVFDVDPVRFEQILINLLNNAAKYTNPGGRIEIHHEVSDGFVVLKVKDNGIGIAEEHLAKIFHPFWQMKASTAGGVGGVGIGLSLTKHIVEMHGGDLSVESAGLGKGCVFTVRIPIRSRTHTVAVHTTETLMPVRPFRVLVADDNQRAADALAKLLTLKGHRVEKVYSGNEVFEVVKAFDPEVILLDIGLPDMTGYEVVEQLRKRGFKRHIIALSGYGGREDKEKAMQSGFDHHITKPMAIEQFEDYLRTIQKEH